MLTRTCEIKNHNRKPTQCEKLCCQIETQKQLYLIVIIDNCHFTVINY